MFGYKTLFIPPTNVDPICQRFSVDKLRNGVACFLPNKHIRPADKMLDVTDFIKERGGDPEKIRESQRRRYAKVEVVDEVITMFEDHRRTNYEAMQLNTKINEVQKQIGAKKKVRELSESQARGEARD